MTPLVAVTLLAPVSLATMLAFGGRPRRWGVRWGPWAALPALLLAVFGASGTEIHLPWLLLGSAFGLDDTGRVFLSLTAAVWLLAGLYAKTYLREDPGRVRYFAYHLIALAGNLALVLARDIPGFYLGFLTMTLAAFGMIIHDGTKAARRAARVYLIMAVGSEGVLLFGFVAAARAVTSEVGHPWLPALVGVELDAGTSLLLLLGFGVKTGLPFLHMWLPLAHPQAPTPASAALSGTIIKAGLLGWLRFLPLGATALPWMGDALVAAGLIAAGLGVVIGLLQRTPKALLAYSSISQMGLVTVAVGVALAAPEAWPAAWPAIVLFAVHHALAKGSLFLGAGIAAHPAFWATAVRRLWPRHVLLGGLALASLALVGVPFTSGGLAKTLLKASVGHSERLRSIPGLEITLALAAAGTAMLMVRFLVLVHRGLPGRPDRDEARMPIDLLATWLLSVAAVLVGTIAVAVSLELDLNAYLGVGAGEAWQSSWPALLGIAAYAAAAKTGWAPHVPPGDVLIPLEAAMARARHAIMAGSAAPAVLRDRVRGHWGARRRRIFRDGWWQVLELDLMRWDSAGALWLALGVLLAIVTWGAAGG